MEGIKHSIRRLTETSLNDGIHRTHSSFAANVLHESELIIIGNVYSTQCRVTNMQSDD